MVVPPPRTQLNQHPLAHQLKFASHDAVVDESEPRASPAVLSTVIMHSKIGGRKSQNVLVWLSRMAQFAVAGESAASKQASCAHAEKSVLYMM